MSKRDDILDAARRCFYDHGIGATGVDLVAAEAGVSKRTLYNHFPAKDDLVLAYLERSDDEWRAWLDEHLAGVDDPLDRLLVYVDGYFRPDRPTFRGCLLINAAAELAAGPLLAAVQELKARTHADIAALVAAAGLDRPDETARAIVLLLEGGIALGGVQRDRAVSDDVGRAVRGVIDAAR